MINWVLSDCMCVTKVLCMYCLYNRLLNKFTLTIEFSYFLRNLCSKYGLYGISILWEKQLWDQLQPMLEYTGIHLVMCDVCGLQVAEHKLRNTQRILFHSMPNVNHWIIVIGAAPIFSPPMVLHSYFRKMKTPNFILQIHPSIGNFLHNGANLVVVQFIVEDL